MSRNSFNLRRLLSIAAAVLWLSSLAPAQTNEEAEIRLPVEARITQYRGVSKHLGYYIGGFHPNYIEVNVGQTVTLVLSSQDGFHSLEIPELGLATETVGPGESTSLTFVASRDGDFEMHCNTRCGAYHKQMVGRLVIVP
jgi:heme/copper-type cytochrome/quinol oxidase subunit 2